MSVFDRYGNFVYLNDGSLSSEEEAEEASRAIMWIDEYVSALSWNSCGTSICTKRFKT